MTPIVEFLYTKQPKPAAWEKSSIIKPIPITGKQVIGVVCLFISDNKFTPFIGRKLLKLYTDCGILSIEKGCLLQTDTRVTTDRRLARNIIDKIAA